MLHEGRPIALGGIKQRATLGFLLLKANQVVPTSQLVEALWPGEDPPPSARKMLQNAVWSLRTALSVIDGPGAPRLFTQTPGYVLRIAPEQIDLFQFQQQAERGRSESASPERAAILLHEALGMWRGTALADLVESGISWPELTVVTNSRLDTMEDYFDAELACGRHQSVLGELEAVVEAERLRERSCGQLMLALYRCGRHANALAVHGRLRTALVEDLGLEPGPALQELQHAILTHDPALTLPRPAPREVAPVGRHLHPVDPIPRQRHALEPQRQHVSLAMVRVGLGSDFAKADPAEVDHALASVTSMVRAGIEELGGMVATSIGSTSLAVFGGPNARGNEERAVRAVRAALALRDSFSGGMGRKLVVHIAVVTGKALVRSASDAPTVEGRLVDGCHQLLSAVPDGAVWVGERTHALTADTFTATPGAKPGAWQVESARDGEADEHDSDLAMVRGLLDRTVRRGAPHLVTVLGEATEFLAAFERSADILTLTGVVERDVAPGALAQVIASHCGVDPEDLDAVRATLTEETRRLCRTEWQADRLTSRLLPLFTPQFGPQTPNSLDAWRQFLELAARDRPLAVVLRDVHLADEAMLDAVESLADSTRPVPLLVMVSAQASLLERRPNWSGGKQHAASITLTPPKDGTVDRLRRAVLSAVGKDGPRLFGETGDPTADDHRDRAPAAPRDPDAAEDRAIRALTVPRLSAGATGGRPRTAAETETRSVTATHRLPTHASCSPPTRRPAAHGHAQPKPNASA